MTRELNKLINETIQDFQLAIDRIAEIEDEPCSVGFIDLTAILPARIKLLKAWRDQLDDAEAEHIEQLLIESEKT